MTYNEFKYLDVEDIEDLLAHVEASFDIRLDDNELIHITTFRELFDHIIDKIQLVNSADCTSQQAFYKLRNAISSTLHVDSRTIMTEKRIKQDNDLSFEAVMTLITSRLKPMHETLKIGCRQLVT